MGRTSLTSYATNDESPDIRAFVVYEGYSSFQSVSIIEFNVALGRIAFVVSTSST